VLQQLEQLARAKANAWNTPAVSARQTNEISTEQARP
jgi:hypothetical protein